MSSLLLSTRPISIFAIPYKAINEIYFELDSLLFINFVNIVTASYFRFLFIKITFQMEFLK